MQEDDEQEAQHEGQHEEDRQEVEQEEDELEAQHEGQHEEKRQEVKQEEDEQAGQYEGHPLPGVVLLDLEDSEHDEEQMQAAWSLPTGAGLNSKNSFLKLLKLLKITVLKKFPIRYQIICLKYCSIFDRCCF